MSYRVGDAIHHPTIRCPKPDCRRLLINGEGCGCTWRVEPEPDPLVGQILVRTDPDTGKVIAVGRVTEATRDECDLSLTLEPFGPPEAP